MKSVRMATGGFLSFPDELAQTVQVNGKTVHFDFDRRFGPLLTDSEGEPLKRQPTSDRHPFWAPFKVWLAEWEKRNPPIPVRHPSDHLDRKRR